MQIPWGEDWTFQMMMADLIDSAQMLLKYGVAFIGDTLTDNMMKGVNALRCAVTNVGENSWNLLAAIYWAAVGFGQDQMVNKYLDIGYEYVCTCQEDARQLIASFGGESTDGGRTDYMLGHCSETGSVKKDDAAKERQKKVEEKIEANMRALKKQAFLRIKDKKKKEMEQMMESKGPEAKKELERKQLEAFKEMKELADKLEGKETISKEEAKQLEELQQTYEAIKAVKEELIIGEVKDMISAKREEGGIEGLQDLASDTALDINALTNKLKEFPDDEDVLLELKEAETQMTLIKQTFEELANESGLSETDAKALSELDNFANEQEMYNTLYEEALPIARAGDDMELDMYFQTIEKNFFNAEIAFEEAQ